MDISETSKHIIRARKFRAFQPFSKCLNGPESYDLSGINSVSSR